MQIVYRNINDITPYEKNPRQNDEAVDYVAKSIKEFGFKVPIIIDKNYVIVSGHTRLKAAKKLGLKEVPTIMADDLTEEQVKAFRLADNKVSEKAKWDEELLDEELEEILNIDMSEFDFDLTKDLEDLDVEVEPEIKFTEILGEEHNYVVLYFDNEVDWLQAESLLGLENVKQLSTRKDGKITKNMESFGIGRVIRGKEAMEKIRREYENIS